MRLTARVAISSDFLGAFAGLPGGTDQGFQVSEPIPA